MWLSEESKRALREAADYEADNRRRYDLCGAPEQTDANGRSYAELIEASRRRQEAIEADLRKAES
jgi:hypothetical protein